MTLGELTADVLRGSVIVLPVVAVGLLAWWLHDRLAGIGKAFGWLGNAATADFGFEWVNNVVVGATRGMAGSLRKTQTGQLNWNVAAVIGGLVIILVLLVTRAL